MSEKNIIKFGLVSLMNSVVLLGFLTHLAYLVAFYLLEIQTLFLFNIGSILIWLLAWRFNRRGDSFKAFILAAVEVAAHTTVACLVLGWGMGFQYMLFAIIPFTMLHKRQGLTEIGLVTLGSGLLFIALYYLTQETRVASIPEYVASLFFYGNTIIAFTGVGLSGFYFRFVATRSIQKVAIEANTDHLTGLSNRRNLLDEMAILLEQNDALKYCLIICDIDDFKQINDKFGHSAGDEVIMSIAWRLQHNLRQHELIARWGGEEFLIVLPETELEQASEIAIRIKESVNQLVLNVQEQRLQVTLTYGLVERSRGATFEEVISEADNRLYQGKRTGKNKVSY